MNKITIKFGTELKPTQTSCKSQLYNMKIINLLIEWIGLATVIKQQQQQQQKNKKFVYLIVHLISFKKKM